MFKFVTKYISYDTLISYRTYNTDSIRVRFAPSPTGYLHLGGLRTALYNYLFAKKKRGKFILRIEDTDQRRVVPDAIEQLQNDLNWAGIEIDEGPSYKGTYGPYIQSQRLQIYKDHVDILLKNGTAYHCFCTEKRLQLLRREALRVQEIPKYDNRCRNLSHVTVKSKLEKGEASCIRFKISENEETFNDLIYGNISYNISLNEGDPVIIKSDGFPTYHFANVVDDHLMKISHVLRGVEWQISTTKHILLYRAFNWNPPLYGHLPLLINADGTKLSKRQGDIKISHYRENHIFPLALINFIIHSGGGFTKDLDRHAKPKCYNIEELANQFDMSRINTHSGKLMIERLLAFNRLAFKRILKNSNEEKELINQVRKMLLEKYKDRLSSNNTLELNTSEDHIRNILHWSSNRIGKISDLISKDMGFIWIIPKTEIFPQEEINAIELLKNNLQAERALDVNDVNLFLKQFCKANNVKYSNFMKMLRSVLSGLKEGPSVAEIIVILGKENTLQRLEMYLNNVKNMGYKVNGTTELCKDI